MSSNILALYVQIMDTKKFMFAILMTIFNFIVQLRIAFGFDWYIAKL